jgi:hypothetical protein
MLTFPTTLSKELHSLVDELEYTQELARTASVWTLSASDVSSWSVCDHVEHLVRADESILAWLHRAARGEETTKPGRPTSVGYFILLTGIIPRGRGRAPVWTHSERLDRAVVLDRLNEIVESARALRESPGALPHTRATQRHPLLGQLSGHQWVRFAHVHHRHHRKIVTDILARSS